MRLTLIAAACGVALSIPAFAQTGIDLLLDDVVVTAKRFNTTAPAGMTVITASDIAQMPTATLPELLAMQAGIQVRSTDGSSDMAIDLRGFGASGNQNTAVLLNGQRLNEIELTTIPWSTLPLDAIERIEILRGSGAVLWGGGTTGGVINIITRTPGSLQRNKASISLGSYNTRKGEVSLDHTGERLGLNISASALKSDNYRRHNAIDQKNIEAALRMPLDHGALTLRLGGEDQELELPGARSRTELLTDRRGATTPEDFNTRTTQRTGIHWERRLNTADLNVDLSWRKNHRTALLWGSVNIDTENQVLTFSPRLRVPHGLLGLHNSLVVGLDWDDWNYDSNRNSDWANTMLNASQRNTAIYLQNESQITQDTALTLGGRLHRAAYAANNTISNDPDASGNAKHDLAAWELGLSHRLNDEIRIYGHLGRSFRIPTADEIYDFFADSVTPLLPQTSHDRELGVEWKRAENHLRLAAYHMDLNNEIHYNAITYTNMNLSPTRRYGLEVDSAMALSRAWSVTASYTYAIAKFREGVYSGTDVSGNDVPLVPRHSASLGATWRLTEEQQLTASIRYVGKQRFDNDQANTFTGGKMPAYTVTDLKYSHTSGPWHFTAAVHNLLDEKYVTYAIASTTPGSTNYNAYPAPERHFQVLAEYRF